jgi:rubrerythrin/CheY-like chemotaxis protein
VSRGYLLAITSNWRLRKLIRANLEAAGVEVREAISLKHGVGMLRDDPPGLILLDLDAPDVDMKPLLWTLHTERLGELVPIVLMSDEPPKRRLLQNRQVAGFLQKPFAATTLLERVRHALEHRPQMVQTSEREWPLSITAKEGDNPMKEMTRENLAAAFAGESQAAMKYLAFASKAQKEGKPNIARLFEAIAYAEQVHAINHFKELGGIGSTASNLDAAIGGEVFEVDEMYSAYLAVAEAQNEKGAHRSMTYAIEAEKIHADMYADAKRTVEAGKDLEIGKVYICPVCGFTHIDEPPDRCPVCKAKREVFKVF